MHGKEDFEHLNECRVSLENLVSPSREDLAEWRSEHVEVAYHVDCHGNDVTIEYEASDLLAHPWPTQFLASVDDGDDEGEDKDADHDDHEKATPKECVLAIKEHHESRDCGSNKD